MIAEHGSQLHKLYILFFKMHQEREVNLKLDRILNTKKYHQIKTQFRDLEEEKIEDVKNFCSSD